MQVGVWILPDIYAGTVDFPGKVIFGKQSEEVLLTVDSLPGGRLEFFAEIITDLGDDYVYDDFFHFFYNITIPDRTILLNEVMAAPEDGNAEWIELYNSGESPVNLFNWRITDFPENSGQLGGVIEEHVFIAPNGYAFVTQC